MTRRHILIGAGSLLAGALLLGPAVLRLYFSLFPFDILGAGHADFSAHLAGEYRLFRTSAYQIMIAPESGVTKSTPIVPAMVVQCATDGYYIIAKRHGLKRRSPNDPADTYEEEDPTKQDYWILDAINPKAYGPLNLTSYLRLRAELAINHNLQLRDVDDFRPKS